MQPTKHLLTDRSEEIVAGLLGRSPGSVHIIMDNAGTEEAMDLAWSDLLLTEGLATEIVLHVKMLPVLVSDVIPADLHDMLRAMTARGGAAAGLSARLSGYMQEGRLRMEAGLFLEHGRAVLGIAVPYSACPRRGDAGDQQGATPITGGRRTTRSGRSKRA